MPSELEVKLYHEARDRALTRLVEGNTFRAECETGFSWGLAASEGFLSNAAKLELVEKLKSESNFAFSFVCGLLCKMESVKGRSYAASWQKRGERDGAMVNVQRKFDRLESALQGTQGETLTQTLGDMAVYAAKWTVLRAEISPEEFAVWMEEIATLIKKQREELGSI
jgi:hypothetical protein